MAASPNSNERISWPKRAVVTAGMPYGNKPLHFGHIAGVFVPADAFARFLRDRIGAANVRFISGTDCFGSPINEGYRKLVEAGEFDGTIAEYVERNHEAQKNTLDAYGISLSIYEGSGMGHSGDVHQLITEKFIEKLHENGHLQRRSTLQFYDAEAGTFLNGRQVVGRCPVQGCKSEHAYADECDLGHSYSPEDLIAPKSSLTGTTPEMRPVENWYFDLPAFADFLRGHVAALDWMGGKVGTGEAKTAGTMAGEPAADGTRRGVGIFNLGTGTGSSVLDVVHSFERACGRELPYQIKPRRAGDVAVNYAACDKARDELGWVAQYDLDRMCADGWRWQSQNPDGYATARA